MEAKMEVLDSEAIEADPERKRSKWSDMDDHWSKIIFQYVTRQIWCVSNQPIQWLEGLQPMYNFFKKFHQIFFFDWCLIAILIWEIN